MWQIQSIKLKDVRENYLSLLGDNNQIRKSLNWSTRNCSLKINPMNRKELLGETWKPGICSFYLMKWFLHLLCIVGTLYFMEWLVWLINLIPMPFTQNSFSEWNFTCQQGVLNSIWKEPYGFQLKGIIPNHWNISVNKRTIAVAWQQS